MKINLTILDKKTLEKIKAESEGWSRKKSLDDIGVCTQSTTGTISGNDHIRTIKKHKFYHEDKNMYKIATQNKSVKIFTGKGRDLDEVIQSDADYRKMTRIMNHLNNNNMVLLENNMKKIAVPATKTDLMVYTKLNQRRNSDFFSRMKKLGIMKEDARKYIYVNPLYCLGGSGISPEVYYLFKDDLDKVLPKNTIEELHAILYFKLHSEELKKAMFYDDYEKQLKTQKKNDLK